MHHPWHAVQTAPPWIRNWEPLTTGFLGQSKVKLWVAGNHALAFRSSAVLYPVLPEPLAPEIAAAARTLLKRLAPSWCVMGPVEWLGRVQPLLPSSRLLHDLAYAFLVREASASEVPHGVGVLRRTGPADLLSLLPLHEAYEKEEVLFSPEDFQPLASRLHFSWRLKMLPSAALFEGRQPLAKVAVSAMTDRWVQWGGVFTRRDRRREGHQRRLLSWFLNDLNRENRGVCLFVKMSNVAAINLYRSLGFQDAGEFRIRYGERYFVDPVVPIKI